MMWASLLLLISPSVLRMSMVCCREKWEIYNTTSNNSLLPTVGKPVFDEAKRASWFSHKAEKATPYYYSVYLADYDVTAELCPTERAALMAFTFPKSDQANVVFDAFDKGSYIQVIPA